MCRTRERFHPNLKKAVGTSYTMLFTKNSTTVVYIMVMLLLNLVQRVSSTSLVEIDVVLVEMTESWVLVNPNRTFVFYYRIHTLSLKSLQFKMRNLQNDIYVYTNSIKLLCCTLT